APNLQPMDPVTLGLCSQIDLDLEVHRAAKEKPVDPTTQGATLLPASETTIRPREPEAEEEKKPSDELNVDAVFAKLKQIGGQGLRAKRKKRGGKGGDEKQIGRGQPRWRHQRSRL